jgi:hypothetical protein
MTQKNWQSYILLAIPVLVFWWCVFMYSINVPWFDDIEVFPGTVVDWLTLDLSGGLRSIFKPNNEHRMLVGKAASVLCYELTGQLNMQWMIWVLNLNVMGLVVIFWKVFKQQSLSPFYFLPVLLFFLQPQYYLTSHWAITGWQHFSAIFWGFFALYQLSKNTFKNFIFAIICGFIASFSMSNGLFYWAAGLVVLWLQKNFKLSIIWGFTMVLAVVLYFYGFDNSANSHGLDYFKQHSHESFFGFFTFLGGSFDFLTYKPIFSRAIIPTLGGFVIVSFCFWQIFKLLKPYFKKDFTLSQSQVFVLGFLSFLFANASVIALLRPRFGYFVMLVGNYKQYPALLLVGAYFLFVFAFRNKTLLLKGIVVIALVFNVASFLRFVPELADRRRLLLVNAYNQNHNKIGLAAQYGSDFAKYIADNMDLLSQRKAYIYPEILNYAFVNQDFNASFPEKKISITQKNNDVWIENTDFEKGNGKNDGAYLILKSAKRSYLVFCNHPDAGQLYRKNKGFKAQLIPKSFEHDIYQIGVCEIRDNEPKLYLTNQQIQITN